MPSSPTSSSTTRTRRWSRPGLPESITDDTVVQASVPDDRRRRVRGRVARPVRRRARRRRRVQLSGRCAVGRRCRRVDRQGQRQGHGDSTVGRLDTAARLLALIGLVVLIGGGLLAVQVRQTRAPASDRMLLWLAWAFLFVGSLGSFGLYGAKVVAGTPSDAIKPSVWGKVVGLSHRIDPAGASGRWCVVVGALLATFARRASDVWRGAALVVGVALVLTYSSIGHANAQHPAVAVDRRRRRAPRRGLGVDRRAADVRVRHAARG